MHPIEHLRFIARSSSVDQRLLVHETADALRALGDDPAGLVVCCRRILERHPDAGALWWFAATVLGDPDPRSAARRAASAVTEDPTADVLDAVMPEGATVCVVGWPDLVGDALVRRGDVTTLVVEASSGGHAARSGASGRDLARRLERAESDVELVEAAGIGAAALAADLVVVEARAASPQALLVSSGSRAAASVAYCAEIPVWAVVGSCRVLPEVLFDAAAGLAAEATRPWHAAVETMPLALASHLVGPGGCEPVPGSLRPDCPALPELVRLRR